MAKRWLGSSLDVGGDDIVPARGQRQRAASPPECHGTPGRRADGQSRVCAAGGDYVEDVAPYGVGDVDVADAVQQCLEIGSTERGTERVDGRCRTGARKEAVLVRAARVAHRQTKEETVALAGGER